MGRDSPWTSCHGVGLRDGENRMIKMPTRRLCGCDRRRAACCRRSGVWSSTRSAGSGRCGAAESQAWAKPGVGYSSWGKTLPASPAFCLPFFPLLTLLQPPRPPSWPSPGTILPQGLCMCFACCLGYPSPRCPHGSLPSFRSLPKHLLSKTSCLVPLFKIVTPPNSLPHSLYFYSKQLLLLEIA